MEVNASDILYFFGAGASAPFGIPTMKQFVIDFESFLVENASKIERELYTDIKETLQKQLGGDRDIDLEAVFSVIDGITNYDNREKLGMFPLYYFTESRDNFPTTFDVENSENLKKKFHNFVREKCEIPNESFGKINRVYHDFFNRCAIEFGSPSNVRVGSYAYNKDWVIFTTNYDTCLEYYWREITNIGISTGFDYDRVRKVDVLNPRTFLKEEIGEIKLLKLHGSVSWLLEESKNKVIELMEKGESHVGRKFKGEIMLYPIAEKELYLDPYISMLLKLNRELEKKSIWVVIGYSYNDPIIREIFLKKSTPRKHLVLIHPHAKAVFNHRLKDLKGERYLMEKKFGVYENDEYKKVNHQMIHKLKENPRFQWSDLVLP